MVETKENIYMQDPEVGSSLPLHVKHPSKAKAAFAVDGSFPLVDIMTS